MNILTTIPDEAIPAWQARVDQYNAGSGQPPVDIEGFAQIFRDDETAAYIAAKNDADKQAMADNPRFMALATAVAARPDKFDAVEAVVLPILQS